MGGSERITNIVFHLDSRYSLALGFLVPQVIQTIYNGKQRLPQTQPFFYKHVMLVTSEFKAMDI